MKLRFNSIVPPFEIKCGRKALFMVLGILCASTVSLAQERPASESNVEFVRSGFGISVAEGAARMDLVSELNLFLDASRAERAGRTLRFYERTRDETFVNALSRLMPTGERDSDASNAALIALYVSTDGDNWTNNTNWDINATPTPNELSSWYGVTVRQGEVASLELQDNNLIGTLPAELGDLSNLEELSLHLNSLSGEIPIELGNLSRLRDLSLFSNSLTGEIPTELANLSQLQELSLYGNTLSGEIPLELGSLLQLESLELHENSLTGEIPPDLGNLSQLRTLSLSSNALTGKIPKELGDLSQLGLLWLHDNSLTGEIPPELGNLPQLEWLWLDNNSLTGEIPPEIGNLPQLKLLWLDGNSLTGEIPSELGNPPQLAGLWLQGNSLTGEIPHELGNLSQLKLLWLHDNSLSGQIPHELGNLSQLRELKVNDNALTGVLPRSLMQLDSLLYLFFEGQALCAPSDDAFQAWLSTVPNVNGPTCAAVQFAGDVEDQTYTVGQAISDLVLPEASGGVATLAYTLEPPLPAGLAFDDATRTISGSPTAVTPATSYTYSATDNAGSSASLTFTIEIVAAVGFQDMIADQSFPRAQPITPLVFPEATGGVQPIEYQLTPSLPTGLEFDAAIRILTGTPTEITSGAQLYTYSATGANGSSDTLQFALEVYSPVAAEHEYLPESFDVRGNYPNPFRQSTRLVFDLPWPAHVTVEVMDIMGRRVHLEPPTAFSAGWEHGMTLSGSGMSSGLYLYRLKATSAEGTSVHTGRLVRVR